ncbi:MAG: hypothetical protein U9Q90_07305 [Campylobacterota bacterium]|nr:hypothetical protein [Campylobacterota bacterium]
MGISFLRIEWIAITMILIMLGVSYLIKADQNKAKKITFSKEMEVYHSTTIEVSTNGVESRLYTDFGVREQGKFKLTRIIYRGKSVEELKAEKGRIIGDKIYLDHNVTLLQKNGYIYKGDHAIYDKNKEFLQVTSPFVAYMDHNVIHGVNLQYDVKKKVATAENVNAVIYTNNE